jgi:hypothetical protein
MTTVGPLYSLKLGPAGPQEADRPTMEWLGRLANKLAALGSRTIAERFLSGLRSTSAATSSPICRDELGWRRIQGAIAILRLCLLLNGDSACTANECGVELVDVSRVGQGRRKVGPNRPVL